MIQFITENDISLSGKRIQHSQIRHVSCIEDDCVFGMFEIGYFLFQIG